MSNNYLSLITEFNKNLKMKNLNINEVVDKMNQIEVLLKLNYHSGVYDPMSDNNKVCRVYFGRYNFNWCLFQNINNYKHLTTNKRELYLIYKIGKIIAGKFTDYLYEYEAHNVYHIDI